MDGISALDISASGMRAQRLRMELIANNLANSETTDAHRATETGSDGQLYTRFSPYRRRTALFRPGIPGRSEFGVTVQRVVEDPSDFRAEFRPDHQHSVKTPGSSDLGRLYLPNVNPMIEMVDMISASRAYEANVTAADLLKTMGSATLRILA